MKLPLEDLLPDQAIITNLRANSPIGVIEELAARAYTNGWLADKPWFVGAVVERESLSSTAMEGGVAFLHTRAKDKGKIGRPFIIVGRSWEGIPFGAPDGNPTYPVLPARPQVRPPAPADPRPARARAAQPGHDREAALAVVARSDARAAAQGGRRGPRRASCPEFQAARVQAQARPPAPAARDPPPPGRQGQAARPEPAEEARKRKAKPRRKAEAAGVSDPSARADRRPQPEVLTPESRCYDPIVGRTALYRDPVPFRPARAEVQLEPDALAAARCRDGWTRRHALDGVAATDERWLSSRGAACGRERRFVRMLMLERGGERDVVITPPDHGAVAPNVVRVPEAPAEAAIVDMRAWEALAEWVLGGGRLAACSIADLARLACIATPQFAVLIGEVAAQRALELVWAASGPLRGGSDLEAALQPLVDAAKRVAARRRGAGLGARARRGCDASSPARWRAGTGADRAPALGCSRDSVAMRFVSSSRARSARARAPTCRATLGARCDVVGGVRRSSASRRAATWPGGFCTMSCDTDDDCRATARAASTRRRRVRVRVRDRSGLQLPRRRLHVQGTRRPRRAR